MTALMQMRHVAVRQLAEDLQVSEATVRRDLKALADRNQLTLIHGGATLSPSVDYSFRAKQQRQVEEKRLIASLAASLVQDGDQVFLDSGTTCFEMAGLLQGRRSLSVLVNSARLTLEFTSPGHSVIMLGGQYRPERMDTVGPITMSTLDQLRGYLAFIGADGLSMDFGPSASDIESAHLYRLVVRHARRTVLLADHTKFNTPSLFRIVDWDAIDYLVTDHLPDDHWLDFLEKEEIELIHPGSPPSAFRLHEHKPRKRKKVSGSGQSDVRSADSSGHAVGTESQAHESTNPRPPQGPAKGGSHPGGGTSAFNSGFLL